MGEPLDLQTVIDTIPSLVVCGLPDSTVEFVNQGWNVLLDGHSEGDRFTLSVYPFACRHALTAPVALRVWRPTKSALGRRNYLRHSH